MQIIKMEEVHLTEPLSLAIGFFDGLHLGHMSLINEVLKYKAETKTAVMSFDVHPLCVLKGEKRQSIITLEEKKELLEEMGIDYLLVIHFTKEVAALSPQAFIDEYLNKNTTEGYYALLSIHKLVKNKKIDMPIINIIYDIAIKGDTPHKLPEFLINKA